MSELSLTVSRRINAPAEKVFEAWLDPKMLTRFMLPASGMEVPRAETDPRVGGRFEIIMVAGGNEMPHGGVYKEIDRHQRLVFTWESPMTTEGSTVTLTFTPAGDAATDVELTHEKFPSEESRDNHKGGWSAILDKLNEVV